MSIFLAGNIYSFMSFPLFLNSGLLSLWWAIKEGGADVEMLPLATRRWLGFWGKGHFFLLLNLS